MYIYTYIYINVYIYTKALADKHSFSIRKKNIYIYVCIFT